MRSFTSGGKITKKKLFPQIILSIKGSRDSNFARFSDLFSVLIAVALVATRVAAPEATKAAAAKATAADSSRAEIKRGDPTPTLPRGGGGQTSRRGAESDNYLTS